MAITSDIKAVNVADDRAGVIERVDLDGLDLDEEQTAIQIYPASSLPKTFAGRLQKVIELSQAGIVDRRYAALLLEDPDLDKYSRLENAPLEDLQATMEHMLVEGKYIAPLEHQDCALGIRVATRYWSRGRINGAPEERLALLEEWMRDAANLLSAGKGKPPEPMTAPPAPGGVPGMPAMPAPGGGMPPAMG